MLIRLAWAEVRRVAVVLWRWPSRVGPRRDESGHVEEWVGPIEAWRDAWWSCDPRGPALMARCREIGTRADPPRTLGELVAAPLLRRRHRRRVRRLARACGDIELLAKAQQRRTRLGKFLQYHEQAADDSILPIVERERRLVAEAEDAIELQRQIRIEARNRA